MSSAVLLKQQKRRIVDRHAKSDDFKGGVQVLSTLLPLAALWYALAPSATISYGLSAAITLAMSLFLLRVFVLMHECGHGSLFHTPLLNKLFGFVFGVVSGMPQYVWSQHHNFHHSTNGNWAAYRGPLAILSVEEYEAMTPQQQRAYVRARRIWMAPLGGLLYLIVNPRLNWIKGTASLVRFLIESKRAQPGKSLRAHAAAFKTRYWESAAEYRHMSLNNLVLLSACGLLAWWIGPALFFTVYLLSAALAGAGGIILFTVQHNFEHSYASCTEGWCYDTAALHGTSFLVLPGWLNWFTANIAYHHVHHLSAKIPNYRLAACHAENRHLFGAVRRLKLAELGRALNFILWDTRARRIISVAELERGRLA